MKKTLVLILFLTTVITNAQDYQYFKATFDSNNAFQLVENTRNGSKSGGLDFDIEAGVRFKAIAVYITYGRFEKIGYQNYAGGLDYYIPLFNKIETSLGVNYGVVSRRNDNYYSSDFDPIDEPVWGGSTAIAFRGTVEIPIYKGLNAVFTTQYQQRPELKKYGDPFILEGVMGLKIKL